MNVLPVIARELRAESRSPFTYWLRVLGAAALLMAAAFFILLHGFRADEGEKLFSQLHCALHLAIWVLVPLLTADCISRERREETLGLLFLTPLKALDIVVAKSLAHGLRAATLVLAVLPVIALPLLMGGVSWKQATASLFLNASALCLALSAGLLASSMSKTWIRALILSFGLATAFAYVFCAGLGSLFSVAYGRTPFPFYQDWLRSGLQLAMGINPGFFLSAYYYRNSFLTAPGMMSPAVMFQAALLASIGTLLISTIVLMWAAAIAAVFTRRNWQQRPQNPFAIWLTNKFCTPVVMLGVLRHWMKRKLDRNPIGWLEQRTWSGRLVIWSWFAVMISVYSLVLTNPVYLTRNLNGVHIFMGWVLLLSMAVNASTSFRRERENGALELLLVSPLTEAQIISGRLRGIWGQFIPSMALLLGGWIYLTLAFSRSSNLFTLVTTVAFFVTGFISVPMIGIYYSLLFRNFLTSLITTVLVALVMPSILGSTIILIVQLVLPSPLASSLFTLAIGYLFHPCLVQLVVAGWKRHCLHERLVNRRFATETT